MPKGNASNDDMIEEEDRQIADVHHRLAADMDKLHDILHKSIKQHILNEG